MMILWLFLVAFFGPIFLYAVIAGVFKLSALLADLWERWDQ